MVRKMVLFAAAGLAAATVLATSPADASYRVIRWNVTGVCQIWDYGMPTRPFPLNYEIMTHAQKTFAAALRLKERHFDSWHCRF